MSAAVIRPRSKQDQHGPRRVPGEERPQRRLLLAAAAWRGGAAGGARGALVGVVGGAVAQCSARERRRGLGCAARVDRVLSAARPQHAMPGMGSDDDPVAEGERRVSVEVTLQAPGNEPVRFSVDDFALRVEGGGEPSAAPLVAARV